MNNLYGNALAKPLPESEYSYVSDDELTYMSDVTNILNVNAEGEYCYIFDIDGETPINLHDKHSDLPLLPENIKITKFGWDKHSKNKTSLVKKSASSPDT